MQKIYSITRLSIITLLCFVLETSVNAQVIYTVAGTGTYGYTGDGGKADTATLHNPYGVVTDGSGNIYFTDNTVNVIRKITKATGIITTIAGNGLNGFVDGTGTSASFDGPQGIAIDAAGNLYVADGVNQRIRKIAVGTNVVSTIAGTGTAGYTGNNSTASGAELNYPSGVALDAAGNIYIADNANNVIRKIAASNGIITTVVGTGASGFSGDGSNATAAVLAAPTNITFDKAGNMYIVDYGNQRIRKVAVSTNIISTIAGTGVAGYTGNGIFATASQLYNPYGVAVDTIGNVYITDAANNMIRKIGTDDTLRDMAGFGQYANGFNGDHIEATSAELNNPLGITLDKSGNIFFLDQNNYRLREINLHGPNITVQPPSINVCDGLGGEMYVTVSGTGNTYQWLVDSNYTQFDTIKNSSQYTGATTDTLHIKKASGSGNQYQYECIINNGYIISNAGSIYVNSLPYIYLSVPSDSVCPGVPTSLTVNGQGGESMITAHGSGVIIGQYGLAVWSTGDSTNTITVSPMTTTVYTVALTQYGCTAYDTITVMVDRTKIKPIAFPSSSICAGNSITLSGQGAGGTYSWSAGVNNNQSFSPSASKTYSVSAVDSYGCTINDSIKIIVNPLPVISIASIPNDSICYGTKETLTASGASTYNWNNGISNGISFSPSSSNVYYVSGTDANGCTSSASLAVVVNPLPVVTGSASPDAVCAGSSVTLSGNGAASYSWSSGVTNGISFVPTSSGSYTLTGTSKFGCTNTATVNVTVDPLPVIAASAFPTAVLCQGSSLALFGSGGASYAWSGGVNNAVSFTPAASKTYTVTGIDANGCTNKDSIKVTVHTKVVPTITSANTSCGLKNGMASVMASNGIPPYSYNWSTTPTKSTASVDSLAAGTYVVSVSDSANCASTVAVSIASSTAPFLTVSTNNSNCGSIGTGSASVTVNGGTAPYRYMWNNGDTLTNNYNLKAATYIITVTDINGCSTFAPAIVSNANGPKINTLSTVSVKCYGDATGAISINVTGGTAPYQYSWSNGATTASISSLYSGPYQLTVIDADSCTSVETFTIGQPHAPVAAITSSAKADCGIADGSASVTVIGGSSPYAYSWNNGNTTASDANIIAGIYSVIITDNNGCKDSAHVSVSDKTGPALVMSLSSNATCGSGGLLSVAASGPNAPFSYAWSNGATTTSISNVPAGNYNVTVTDSKGCTSSTDTTVTELTPPGISLCMVTVDPVSNKHNIIIWDKSNTPKIASYNIYKESTAAGVYFKIASVPFAALGTYVDSLSDPTVRSWRYKISQVDECGNESPLSANHKTMHLTVNQGLGNNVNLIWDNYEGLNFSTYYVYRDTVATNFTLFDSIPNNIFTYTDNNPWHTKKPLLYRIGISNPGSCTPAIEAINYNASKSNTGALTFNPSLGIKTINVLNSLQIFPNPSTGIVTFSVELAQGNEDLSLTVINTLGQELMTANYSRVSGSFSKEVDLSNLAKGVYFFKLKTNSNTTYRKVVLQ